ncbi:MAG: CRISPR-associated endonuclease Cas2 [bacterium]|nr:CRISPR-associated endonuclease Cas2 [bacterium]
MVKLNTLTKKVLLLLAGGLALGCTYHPGRQWKIIRSVNREWKKINEKELWREIRKLYRSRLVEKKENPDGSLTFVLSTKGKIKTLNFRFEKICLQRENWDKKWRLVIFDIPERLRQARDALREKLKQLGFYELQKSVFVFPYECEDEIDFVIEFFEMRQYVRTILAEKIDNELHLKKIFDLI